MLLRNTVWNTLLCVFAVSATATSLSFNRRACQKPGNKALRGCPQNTLVVGPHEHFHSVQDAVLSLPQNNDSYVILIQPGDYTEQVNVTRQGPLALLGVTSSPNDRSKNQVNIIWHNATGTPSTGSYDNAYTSVLTVAPTLNASFTGTGPTGFAVPTETPFGNSDFRTYNLNFINDYLPYTAGPSLALSLSYANGGFYHTRFLSYQDTVSQSKNNISSQPPTSLPLPQLTPTSQIYIGKLGTAYLHSSEIAGQTDFLYGFGTCWVTSSLVSLRGCGGGITAWKGTNTTFANKYGVYIHDSIVQKANSSLEIAGQCALGRPWNAQHRSIFANNYLDDSIRPEGYVEWQAVEPRVNFNTTMAEYHDFGPGYNSTGRKLAANVTIELTRAQYEPYSTVERVFQFRSGEFGNTAWIDRNPRA